MIDFQTKLVEQLLDRAHCPIGKMLVIDIIEFGVLEDFTQIDRLDAEGAAVADQLGNALGGAVQFFQVKEHARRRHQLGCAAGFENFFRRGDVEKGVERVGALLLAWAARLWRVDACGLDVVPGIGLQPGAVLEPISTTRSPAFRPNSATRRSVVAWKCSRKVVVVPET